MSGRRRKPRKGGPKQAKAAPPAEFWRAAPEPPEPEVIELSEHPTALIESMNTPPLPGNNTAATEYFAAVVTRAAGVAAAVATSADLFKNDDT